MLSLDSTEKVISILSAVASVGLFLLRKILLPYCKKAVEHVQKWLKVLKRLDTIDSVINKTESLGLLNNYLIKLLTEKHNVGIYICDKSGLCIWTNETLQKIFHAGAADMINDGWFNFLHPDDVKRVFDAWKSSVNNWCPYKVRYRVIFEDKIINCEAICDIIRNDKNEAVFYVGEVSILS